MPDVRPDAIRSPRGSQILPIELLRPVARNSDLHGSPRLSLTIGRDRHSSAVSVLARTVSGGMYPRLEVLLAERWNQPIESLEAEVLVAIQALQSVLGKIRGIQS